MVEVKHPRIKRTSTIVILRSARPLANDKFTSSVQKSTHFATFYLFLSLSIAKFICSSIILYIYVPIYTSIYVSVNLSMLINLLPQTYGPVLILLTHSILGSTGPTPASQPARPSSNAIFSNQSV